MSEPHPLLRCMSEKDYQRLRKIIPNWKDWKDIHISSLKIEMERIKEADEILKRCASHSAAGNTEQRIRDAIAELESALDTGYMYETGEHVRRAIALLRRG